MRSDFTQTQGKYYIGLMSGTSADGIDLALVDFTEKNTSSKSSPKSTPNLVASYYQPYSAVVAEKIISLYQPGNNEVDRAFHLDIELAQLFSQAIISLLSQEKLSAKDIIAIGNHGQTIRHRPSEPFPFTLQIGCCQTLATLTGIRVVGQFRRKDMALGGQGAPLVPIFHQQLFGENTSPVFVVNIGGIANLTFLPEQGSTQSVLGFDTGPGNALLDDWFSVHNNNSKYGYDKDGEWAAAGNVNQHLLWQLLQDDYINFSAPKSTGREYFNLDWLNHKLTAYDAISTTQLSATQLSATQLSSTQLSPIDIQATLLAFTAQTISNAVKILAKQGKVYLCGGGVHNTALVSLLNNELYLPYEVQTMESLSIDGDILEAVAFAWLAYAFDHKLVSNMPAVTGASSTCTLGTLFFP